jgi:hypothetical protein
VGVATKMLLGASQTGDGLGSASFWKKKQKLLRGCRGLAGDKGVKVFWFFFSKKNCFLS